MIAGYSDFPGYGNTPIGGIKGFETIFTKSKSLNSVKRIEKIDALILWGGSDIGTALYNELPVNKYQSYWPSARDVFEFELIKTCVKRKIPIIGVCRGAQMLCAYAGGKLAQHINGHQLNHSVKTWDNKIFEQVSSSHHQMMYPYKMDSDDYTILATTNNCLATEYEGLSDEEKQVIKKKMEPEAIYFNSLNAIGIQWHPEWQLGHVSNAWMEQEILVRLYGETVTS